MVPCLCRRSSLLALLVGRLLPRCPLRWTSSKHVCRRRRQMLSRRPRLIQRPLPPRPHPPFHHLLNLVLLPSQVDRQCQPRRHGRSQARCRLRRVQTRFIPVLFIARNISMRRREYADFSQVLFLEFLSSHLFLELPYSSTTFNVASRHPENFRQRRGQSHPCHTNLHLTLTDWFLAKASQRQ